MLITTFQLLRSPFDPFLGVPSGWSPTRKLIWCDPVNIFESLGWFLYLSFRGQGQQQPWQVMATIDQADIRGSEPHNHDPSGAASDY